MQKEKMLEKLRLQLFAEGGNEGGAGEEGGAGGAGEENKGSKEDKTFTQAELNAIAKKEKEAGKKAILKELGFEDIKSVKEGLEELRKWQDSQKTEAEKAAAALKAQEKAAAEAQKKLELAEAKLTAIKMGVNPAYVDDVVALSMLKVSDEKDLATVLEEMKKTYPNFFSEEEPGQEDKGTGSKLGGKKGKVEVEGIGERLAKKQGAAIAAVKKNPYFD
jgi:hypothetical protein